MVNNKYLQDFVKSLIQIYQIKYKGELINIKGLVRMINMKYFKIYLSQKKYNKYLKIRSNKKIKNIKIFNQLRICLFGKYIMIVKLNKIIQ